MRKFQNGETTIIQGDTLEVLDKTVSDGSVNLIFADPPYNIGERRWLGFLGRYAGIFYHL